MDIRRSGRVARIAWVTVLATAAGVLGGQASADTLEEVRGRGFLVCGIGDGQPGFAAPDPSGNWTGFDVDICRAVTAAVFGDTSHVKFRPVANGEGLTALRKGEVDLLARGTSWTMSLEAANGLRFAGVSFFDGQSLLVRREMGVTSALELSGARICATADLAQIQGLSEYFKARQMPFQLIQFERAGEALKAYAEKRCDALSGDLSTLAGNRLGLPTPDEHMLLPEIIAKEPLGPVVRQGDERWLGIVEWTLHAMVAAEELGIGKNEGTNVDADSSPAKRRLLGIEADLGQSLGLPPQWGRSIISLVGNYGEVFERNVGPHSPLGLPRGLNRLWSDGGLLYAPSMR